MSAGRWIVAVLLCACGDQRSVAPAELDFAAIFGSQEIRKNSLFGSSRLPDEYVVSVWVGPGRELKLLRTGNPTVTLDDGVPRRTNRREIDPSRTYVHATLRLEARSGRRIYVCTVRILDGVLKGALVPVCDGRMPDHIIEPYQAFYALPPDAAPPSHKPAFEVVHVASK